MKKQSRKEGLKEVLRVLQSVEHKRVYDPPGDSDIVYYLIIRKYIRYLLTFFGSEVQPGAGGLFNLKSSCILFKSSSLLYCSVEIFQFVLDRLVKVQSSSEVLAASQILLDCISGRACRTA
jgi:hypothetical protein